MSQDLRRARNVATMAVSNSRQENSVRAGFTNGFQRFEARGKGGRVSRVPWRPAR
jgi:hypothetical protein